MTKRHIPIILIQKKHVKLSYRKMQSPTPTKTISKPPPLSLWGIDSIPVLSFTHFSLPSSITDAPCALWLLFFLMPLIVSEGAKGRDHQFRHQSMCHLFLCLKSRHVIKREVFFSWKKQSRGQTIHHYKCWEKTGMSSTLQYWFESAGMPVTHTGIEMFSGSFRCVQPISNYKVCKATTNL